MKRLVLSLILLTSISSIADTVSDKDIATLNMLKLYQENIHYVMDEQSKDDQQKKKIFLNMVNNEIDKMQIRENLALLYIDKEGMCNISKVRVNNAKERFKKVNERYFYLKNGKLRTHNKRGSRFINPNRRRASLFVKRDRLKRAINYNQDMQEYICNKF